MKTHICEALSFLSSAADYMFRWAEFDTGPTTLAMTPLDQREVKLRGGADSPDSQGNMEIAITVDDVDVAFKVMLPVHKSYLCVFFDSDIGKRFSDQSRSLLFPVSMWLLSR